MDKPSISLFLPAAVRSALPLFNRLFGKITVGMGHWRRSSFRNSLCSADYRVLNIGICGLAW